ncbi:hypothetical protein NQ318_012181, partial [Aromia moschata]
TGCTPKKVVELFNETHPDRHPISQRMVSNIESKYRNWHVRDLPKSGRPSKSEEDQLNVLLAIQENHHSTLNQLASDFYMAASTVHKIMKKQSIILIKFWVPLSFDVNLGASYLDFLRDDLIPELLTLYPDIEERDRPRNDIFFQQYGASPHYAAP